MTDAADALTEPAVPRLRLSPAAVVAIALGGALGTVARFLLYAAFTERPDHFPTVILVINLSGSLAIGLLVPLMERAAARAPLARPFLIVGVLGGWTTYSTLAVAAVTLIKDGHTGTSLAYLAATVAGGLALVVVGHGIGRRMVAA
jgi:CrcB protein